MGLVAPEAARDALVADDVLLQAVDHGEPGIGSQIAERGFEHIQQGPVLEILLQGLQPALQHRGRAGGGQGPAHAVLQHHTGALQARPQPSRQAAVLGDHAQLLTSLQQPAPQLQLDGLGVGLRILGLKHEQAPLEGAAGMFLGAVPGPVPQGLIALGVERGEPAGIGLGGLLGRLAGRRQALQQGLDGGLRGISRGAPLALEQDPGAAVFHQRLQPLRLHGAEIGQAQQVEGLLALGHGPAAQGLAVLQ